MSFLHISFILFCHLCNKLQVNVNFSKESMFLQRLKLFTALNTCSCSCADLHRGFYCYKDGRFGHRENSSRLLGVNDGYVQRLYSTAASVSCRLVSPGRVSPVRNVPSHIQVPDYAMGTTIKASRMARLLSGRGKKKIEIKNEKQIQGMRDAGRYVYFLKLINACMI